MHKSIVVFLLISVSHTWLVHGQVRGDSIFDGANGGTTGKPPPSADAAKTNSAPNSRPNTVADGALIGFDRLSGFLFQLTEDLVSNTNAAKANGEVNAMIPEDIHALDNRIVSVEGFMVPSISTRTSWLSSYSSRPHSAVVMALLPRSMN
jgi:hypothetical protein